MTDQTGKPWSWERPQMDAYDIDRGHYTIPADHILIIYGVETEFDPGFWRFDGMSDGDAVLIVRAINSHNTLVNALENMMACADADCPHCCAESLRALALATGETP